MDTEVIIVGGGPTGLTLAIDLGLRGVRAAGLVSCRSARISTIFNKDAGNLGETS